MPDWDACNCGHHHGAWKCPHRECECGHPPSRPAQTLDHLDWREPGVPPDAEGYWWFEYPFPCSGELRRCARRVVLIAGELSVEGSDIGEDQGWPKDWRWAPVPSS